MRIARLAALSPGLLSLLLLAGCGDKAAVSLTATIESPVLSVQNGALGSSLDGSFNLHLVLGKEASGSHSIALGSFSVHGSGSTVIDPVPVDASPTTFPITISPGDDKTIPIKLSFADVLSQAQHDGLCPGPAQILGSVLEDGKANGISSGSVSPTCN